MNTVVVPRLLPTDNLVMILTSSSDVNFINEEFGTDRLSDVNSHTIGAKREFRFWVKVIDVGPMVTTRTSMGDRQRHIKVHVTGTLLSPDCNDEIEAFLVLYDEQMALERLFGKVSRVKALRHSEIIVRSCRGS